MSESKIAVLSVSGGMDSTGLLIRILKENYEPYIISFDYGQKHVVELDRLKSNIEYLRSKGFQITRQIVDISGVMRTFYSALTSTDQKVPEGHYADDNMKQTVVPNRNAIFSSIIYGKALSIALEKKSSVIIGLGVHSGDHTVYPDCRPEFYEAIENAFKIGNWDSEKVSYYLPYMNGDKLMILQDSLLNCQELGIDFDLIFKNTNTCYAPNSEGSSCGKCGSCSERLEAFEKLGRKDPVQYV